MREGEKEEERERERETVGGVDIDGRDIRGNEHKKEFTKKASKSNYDQRPPEGHFLDQNPNCCIHSTADSISFEMMTHSC